MKEFLVAVVLCGILGVWAYTYSEAIDKMYPLNTMEVNYGSRSR